MNKIKNLNMRQVLMILLGIIAATPFIITAYVVITTEKESVVFLENVDPVLGLIIFTFYILLFAFGIFWGLRKLYSIFSIKNETSKNELKHLQSQVNPHFFFNVLNNLYGLVEKDSKKAQELIIKLSDMMRYSIYEGQKEQVSIAAEKAYLDNYIELHKMRYFKKIDVNFDANIEDEEKKIMPLMFINLLENAFKHGVEKLRFDAFVHVKMTFLDNNLYFEVKNKMDPEEDVNKNGVGLKNLRRRLELVYPKKHSLNLTQENDIYTAQLMINLK
ncbi:MAG: two-component system sensor histidine kinase AlgZ [Saprospiraceae bacterium]|jgi:two-component system sensor histidine kinase AlgZ